MPSAHASPAAKQVDWTAIGFRDTWALTTHTNPTSLSPEHWAFVIELQAPPTPPRHGPGPISTCSFFSRQNDLCLAETLARAGSLALALESSVRDDFTAASAVRFQSEISGRRDGSHQSGDTGLSTHPPRREDKCQPEGAVPPDPDRRPGSTTPYICALSTQMVGLPHRPLEHGFRWAVVSRIWSMWADTLGLSGQRHQGLWMFCLERRQTDPSFDQPADKAATCTHGPDLTTPSCHLNTRGPLTDRRTGNSSL